MGDPACRWCGGRSGQMCWTWVNSRRATIPPGRRPGPDPVYPLQMWFCSACGLAQLVADPTVPAEPRGTEPAALVAQAGDAVDRVVAAGLLPDQGTVAEYGSPHGGSWLGRWRNGGSRQWTPGRQISSWTALASCTVRTSLERLAERAAR